jgi:prepilin-type N-terminal cleavage/methylation domain-containing protein
MRVPRASGRGAESGFSLLELLITLSLIFIIASIAIPIYASAMLKSRKSALAADANSLYGAFLRYNFDNDVFPSTSSPPTRALTRTTLEPLVSGGYVSTSGPFLSKLQGTRITAYDSPNVGGSDSQFWALLTLASDPGVVVLVASTDQYPGNPGTWYDGVYFVVGSSIVPVS